ncbi:DNA mismatch repair protein [Coriobacteriia bacterium Es71-Z0120]|uniref:Sau3AI family type II restriction endonuclease n=1 Tax=Parvivirga hydrogeniphila TaxID=2939460 RepID=UPI002260FD51|nr:Sau3AI family type II restriction endonuclease [Parvivirga hydrogeniphila]MCL4078277.1 DNA mismatch repair protein [Parvivirga hydrogeniphila]
MPNGTELPYDPTDRDSILAHAQRLIGRTLREMARDLDVQIDFTSDKGGFGSALERHYFRINPGNKSEPDFEEAGIELKSTPLKRVRSKLVAKERLVLGMIDYCAIVGEQWENSSFLRKNAHLLLVFYLHEPGKDPADFVIKIVRLWEFPPEDLEIIRQDWHKIVAKIREGRAHELSEGDTLYLAACTKSADSSKRTKQPYSSVPAKPRALALKASYMNSIIRDSLERREKAGLRPLVDAQELSKTDFESAIAERFAPYIGKTADEIAGLLGVKASRSSKGYFASITDAILGLSPGERAAEFEKAGLVVRTMRILPSGRPKEDISFRAFDYRKLVEQTWEESDLREELSKRFFFVIYRLNASGAPVLAATRFWSMPLNDVETHARACFEETVLRIREDRAEYLPRKSDNPAVHVRPHARDSRDVIETPSGKKLCKKSFWLNGSYIKDQLGL